MSYEKAMFIARRKLDWQVKMKFREGYTDDDITFYATQVYKMQNLINGG